MKHSRAALVRAGAFLALVCVLGLNFRLHAQTEDWRLVPPDAVPASGTFYSLQKGDTQPPFPSDPYLGLFPIYRLDDGVFLIDDTPLGSRASLDPNEAEPDEGEPPPGEPFPAPDYGCGLWLSISASTNPSVLLTLHNTRTGQTYTVWSTEDISLAFTNWSVETNVSVIQLSSTNWSHTIVAMRKSDVYAGSTNMVQYRHDVPNSLTSLTIQPAVNFDAVTSDGYAWFVAKGPPEVGPNYHGGPLLYSWLRWGATNVEWATNWYNVADGGTNYQDYYELAGTNFGTQHTPAIFAPQLGTTVGIGLSAIGSRLMTAVIRNGYLWTCQTVGLSTNGTYGGDATGATVDRSAVQWFKIQVNSDGSGLTLSDHGRVFDPSPTNAWWYYFPSLAVNCPGDMVMGFSGSSPTNYIGALYTWRLAGGSTLGQPRVIQPGTIAFGIPGLRWGDYSATTLDPVDDWSFWTIQAYAAPSGDYHWGTVVAEIRPNP